MSSLRRSARERVITPKAAESQDSSRKRPPPTPSAHNSTLFLVQNTYKKVRKLLTEQKASEAKSLWATNRQQLDTALQSQYNAKVLGDLNLDSGHFNFPLDGGFGRMASVKVFKPEVTLPEVFPAPTNRPRRKKPGSGQGSFPEPSSVSVSRVRVRTLTWVESIPPVVSWTSIPFNVAEEDGKFLTNIPFLGDALIDKDPKFIDDMLNLYQGNLHDLNKSRGTEMLPPLPPRPLTSSERLDDDTLLALVESLQETSLSSDVFAPICASLPGNGTPEEVRARFQSLLRRRRVPQEAGKVIYTIPNIDGACAADLPRKDSMHAFRYLFCRRCYLYDCPRGHNGDDQVDLSQTRRASSSVIAYTCQNPKCWRKEQDQERSEYTPEERSSSDWTPGERSLARSLLPSFPDPCYVAHLLMNRDCVEVKAFSEEDAAISDPPPVQVTPGPGPPPPVRRRSKKSSLSKKNLSRRWINNSVVNQTSVEGSPLPPRFMPCAHPDSAPCDDKNSGCYCAKNGTSCEKFCSCPPSCKIRFPGCRCTSSCDSRRCVCFVAARECDPDLCSGCGAGSQGVGSCRNVSIQRRAHKHLLMGGSDVAGWGIFIKEDVQRGEFIAEYRGEIISHDESERRGHVYDKMKHTFLFELNDHFVVDATRKGNKARFVNSSKTPNCEVKRMLVNGDHRIGIYAKRFIDAGEELFYDYEDVLEKQQRVASRMPVPAAASKSASTSNPGVASASSV